MARWRATKRGFTLFELAVYILVVAVLSTVAMRRLYSYTGEAERANFMAVSAQLRAAVRMHMMGAITRGSREELGRLEGSNPMGLLLEKPVNYLGDFDGRVETASLPRRSWFFDRARGELVYLVDDPQNLEVSGSDGSDSAEKAELRFRVGSGYEGAGARPRGHGLQLEAVTPFRWGG